MPGPAEGRESSSSDSPPNDGADEIGGGASACSGLRATAGEESHQLDERSKEAESARCSKLGTLRPVDGVPRPVGCGLPIGVGLMESNSMMDGEVGGFRVTQPTGHTR